MSTLYCKVAKEFDGRKVDNVGVLWLGCVIGALFESNEPEVRCLGAWECLNSIGGCQVWVATTFVDELPIK